MSNELLDEMKELAELNPVNFYLKFLLKGVTDAFVYRVTKEEQEAVSSWFFDDKQRTVEEIITFTTLSGRVVNVAPTYIRLCQELWDAGRLEPESESEHDLILFVEDVRAPLRYVEVAPEEIDLVASILEAGEYAADTFVGFIDEDGERNWVKAGSVMLMESIEYRENEEHAGEADVEEMQS